MKVEDTDWRSAHALRGVRTYVDVPSNVVHKGGWLQLMLWIFLQRPISYKEFFFLLIYVLLSSSPAMCGDLLKVVKTYGFYKQSAQVPLSKNNVRPRTRRRVGQQRNVDCVWQKNPNAVDQVMLSVLLYCLCKRT